MFTGDVKKELIALLQKYVGDHQKRRSEVTEELIKKYLEIRKLKC